MFAKYRKLRALKSVQIEFIDGIDIIRSQCHYWLHYKLRQVEKLTKVVRERRRVLVLSETSFVVLSHAARVRACMYVTIKLLKLWLEVSLSLVPIKVLTMSYPKVVLFNCSRRKNNRVPGLVRKVKTTTKIKSILEFTDTLAMRVFQIRILKRFRGINFI